MSVETENQSQSGKWIIAVAVALLIYVLSFGPVGALALKYRIEMPWLFKSAVYFYDPLYWTAQQMPQCVGELSLRYLNWWCEAFHVIVG